MSPRTYAHFIGVGGAGMSGIARILHERGVAISGSDLKDSRYTRALEASGVPVHIGHAKENLGEPEVVVVSSAIPQTNPELTAAKVSGLAIWPRAKMLAQLAADRDTIAVAGTHGKTSTSAMVATMLSGMGLDPTFVVGGEVSAYGTNAACGDGPHYVVEADESDGSFLHLTPRVAVITNIEAEHLDHYGSLAEVERTFAEFMSRVPVEGRLVLCADDERLLELAEGCAAPALTYGFADDADVRILDVQAEGIGSRFRVRTRDAKVIECRVSLPGAHMVQNAAAAIAVACAIDADVQAAADALSGFGGVRRRFDRIGYAQGITIVDDYAHHPTEIRATLAAARTCGFGRVWVIFQPHRYSRTQSLAHDFGLAFDDADRIVVTDVYSAGEPPIPGVSGRTVLDALLRHAPRAAVAYLPHRADLVPYVADRIRSGDLLLTMGAGDVTTLGPEVLRAIVPEDEAADKCR